MSKREPLTRVLSIRVSKALLRSVEALAASERRQTADFIRLVLSDLVDKADLAHDSSLKGRA